MSFPQLDSRTLPLEVQYYVVPRQVTEILREIYVQTGKVYVFAYSFYPISKDTEYNFEIFEVQNFNMEILTQIFVERLKKQIYLKDKKQLILRPEAGKLSLSLSGNYDFFYSLVYPSDVEVSVGKMEMHKLTFNDFVQTHFPEMFMVMSFFGFQETTTFQKLFLFSRAEEVTFFISLYQCWGNAYFAECQIIYYFKREPIPFVLEFPNETAEKHFSTLMSSNLPTIMARSARFITSDYDFLNLSQILIKGPVSVESYTHNIFKITDIFNNSFLLFYTADDLAYEDFSDYLEADFDLAEGNTRMEIEEKTRRDRKAIRHREDSDSE